MTDWDPNTVIDLHIYPKLHRSRPQPRGGYTAQCPAHDDGNPSLSVYPDPDHDPPRVVVKCFAGCDKDLILQRWGLDWRDLYPPFEHNRRDNWTPAGDNTLYRTYDYTDSSGKLLYQVVRTFDKQFFQRHPEPSHKSGWKWSLTRLDGTRIETVLYRLPQVLEAVAAGRPVALVEGEKDADRLAAIGVSATTCSGGGGNLGQTLARQFERVLAGAHVVAIPDSDPDDPKHPDREPTGFVWAREVYQRLGVVAGSLRFGTVRAGKDVSDHLDAGFGRADFVLSDHPPVWTPPAPDTLPHSPTTLPNRDHAADPSVLAREPLDPQVTAADPTRRSEADGNQNRPVGDISPTGGVGGPDVQRYAEQVGAAPDDFWASDPRWGAIYDFAYSRLINPWTVLGAVVARISTRIGPHITLPPLVGSRASLNLQIGLVGEPGDGKDAANDLARELIPDNPNRHIPTVEPGTGQGITATFTAPPPTRRRPARAQQDGNVDPPNEQPDGPVQYNDVALFYISEVDNLASHAGMRGSNIMSYLRSIYSGSDIGAGYADREKRHPVGQHKYRASVVVGIQPRRATVLLSPDAQAGGTAQRLIWLPARTPPDLADWGHLFGMEPPDLGWIDYQNLLPNGQNPTDTPVPQRPEFQIRVDPQVWQQVRQDRIDRRWTGLDSHRNQTRLKLAAILGIWRTQGKLVLEQTDWDTAGQIMDVSDQTRQQIIDQLQQVTAEQNKAAGHAEATKDAILEQKRHERALTGAMTSIRRKLTTNGPMTHAALRKALTSRVRPVFEEAIEKLIMGGAVKATRFRGSDGGEATEYTWNQ